MVESLIQDGDCCLLRLKRGSQRAKLPRLRLGALSCYSTTVEVAWWSSTWADRVLFSMFASTALERGFATQEDLDEILGPGNSGVRSRTRGFRFCIVRSFAARAEVVLGLVIRVLEKVCFEYVIDAILVFYHHARLSLSPSTSWFSSITVRPS
jgi:hypothetical protein